MLTFRTSITFAVIWRLSLLITALLIAIQVGLFIGPRGKPRLPIWTRPVPRPSGTASDRDNRHSFVGACVGDWFSVADSR